MGYSAKVLDHLANPRNVGELAPPALIGEATNSACGDQIKLSIMLLEGKISMAKMKAYGCPPTIAAASILTELLIGKNIALAKQLEAEDIVVALEGLPRGKQHAADLAITVLHNVLSNLTSSR